MERRFQLIFTVLRHMSAGVVLVCLGASHAPAAQPPGLIQQGTEAYYRGDLPGAAKLAKRHAALYPKRPEGWILLARTQMAEGAPEAAFKSLREALQRDPANMDGLYYLGLVSSALAGVEFQAMMTMAPDSVRAHQFLAESYVGEGNTTKAVEEYQAALALQPRSVEILLALADLERSRSRYDEALDYYTRANSIEPGNYFVTYGLGLVHLRRGEPEMAIPYFRKAADLDPRASAPRLALGMALVRSGDAEGAISALQTATKLNPKLRQGYTYLAQALQARGRSAEAQQALDRASELAAEESRRDQKELDTLRPESGQTLPLPDAPLPDPAR